MRSILILLAVAVLADGQFKDLAGEDTQAPIARVRENPEDFPAIGVLAKRSDDPQIIPTLRDAFTRDRITGARL